MQSAPSAARAPDKAADVVAEVASAQQVADVVAEVASAQQVAGRQRDERAAGHLLGDVANVQPADVAQARWEADCWLLFYKTPSYSQCDEQERAYIQGNKQRGVASLARAAEPQK